MGISTAADARPVENWLHSRTTITDRNDRPGNYADLKKSDYGNGADEVTKQDGEEASQGLEDGWRRCEPDSGEHRAVPSPAAKHSTHQPVEACEEGR